MQLDKFYVHSSIEFHPSGTVRAFDLTRYRNFKTLTSTRPTQFSCVTVDSSGELVASGSQDSHDIYLWSLQTGRLLEVSYTVAMRRDVPLPVTITVTCQVIRGSHQTMKPCKLNATFLVAVLLS